MITGIIFRVHYHPVQLDQSLGFNQRKSHRLHLSMLKGYVWNMVVILLEVLTDFLGVF